MFSWLACSILDAEDVQAIDALDAGYRYVDGKFWTVDGSPYTSENLWDMQDFLPDPLHPTHATAAPWKSSEEAAVTV